MNKLLNVMNVILLLHFLLQLLQQCPHHQSCSGCSKIAELYTNTAEQGEERRTAADTNTPQHFL